MAKPVWNSQHSQSGGLQQTHDWIQFWRQSTDQCCLFTALWRWNVTECQNTKTATLLNLLQLFRRSRFDCIQACFQALLQLAVLASTNCDKTIMKHTTSAGQLMPKAKACDLSILTKLQAPSYSNYSRLLLLPHVQTKWGWGHMVANHLLAMKYSCSQKLYVIPTETWNISIQYTVYRNNENHPLTLNMSWHLALTVCIIKFHIDGWRHPPQTPSPASVTLSKSTALFRRRDRSWRKLLMFLRVARFLGQSAGRGPEQDSAEHVKILSGMQTDWNFVVIS